MSRVGAIVLCAGSSSRFGSDKLSAELQGKPVWRWSLEAFTSHPDVDEVVVVTTAEKLQQAEVCEGVSSAVVGGATRQESVLAGLNALSDDVEFVLIHDGARPFVTPTIIAQAAEAAKDHGAFMVAVKVVDTIKQSVDRGFETLDRDRLWAAQTPQGGRKSDLLAAHKTGFESTDDASLLEKMGLPIRIVEGDRRNIKLTTAEDFTMATHLARTEVETRTGMGYDIHAFSTDPARPLWLGGVRFEGAPGLEGHSDADVLLHAMTDAILGAVALGDIGQHFPNNDSRWHNASSGIFLREANRLIRQHGWKVVHLDATVLAETPKIMSRAHDIRSFVAEALGISADRVSVKATTNEQLGAIGRKEGIAAMAIATLTRPAPQGD